MGRDWNSGIKQGGMAGLSRKKGGKAGFENPTVDSQLWMHAGRC